MTTFRDHLVQSILAAGRGVDGDEHRAAAVLWTDPDQLWGEIVDDLRDDVDIVTYGAHDGDRRGPAIWIRAAVAGLTNIEFDGPIVVYLPGIGRDTFRNLEDCPDALRPLAELQYRGAFWTQTSGRDWTPVAFIKNKERGIGADVSTDASSIEAIQNTLPTLLGQQIDWLLNRAPLDASTIYSLDQDDPVAAMLQWINEQSVYESWSAAEQASFRHTCQSEYGIEVEDGTIEAARRMAYGEGAWHAVWRRYKESPAAYLGIEERLRQARPVGQTSLSLGLDDSDEPLQAWPQHNEDEEKALREAMLVAASLNREGLVPRIIELEASHGGRRSWVWYSLGKSPLADSLLYLVQLISYTMPPKQGSVDELVGWYLKTGHVAEDMVMRALSAVPQGDRSAVQGVVRALYEAWSDASARTFQKAVATTAYTQSTPAAVPASTCFLFTDGLRYDLGKRLADNLRLSGLTVSLGSQLAALPTITATAKPAVSPVAASFQSGPGLEPTTNGSTKVNAQVLRTQLEAEGFQTLQGGDLGDPTGRAWTEIGTIDRDGHDQGVDLPNRVGIAIDEIGRRIVDLTDAGWQRIEVVTDHGFLFMPWGMQKAELPAHLVQVRKGRCARLTAGAEVEYQTVPWYWDADVRWAVAPGTACFEANKQYEHGGISLPECVVPRLTITRDLTIQPVSLGRPKWHGMRMTIEVDGAAAAIDLRSRPADAASSLLDDPAPLENGTAKVVVTDLEAEGLAAVVVALDEDGNLLGQIQTVVGEM